MEEDGKQKRTLEDREGKGNRRRRRIARKTRRRWKW